MENAKRTGTFIISGKVPRGGTSDFLLSHPVFTADEAVRAFGAARDLVQAFSRHGVTPLVAELARVVAELDELAAARAAAPGDK